MVGISAWRENDVVAYDAMRESATTLIALFLGQLEGDVTTHPSDDSELKALRSALRSIDSYDRDAVNSLAKSVRDRITELTESQS